MKKIIGLIFILSILTFSINAEDKNKKISFGGWGGPELKFSSVGDSNPFSKNSDFAMFIKLKQSFLINNFSLGIAGNVLVNPVSYNCKKTGVSYEDYEGDDSNSDGWISTEACNDQKDPKLTFFYIGIFTGYAFQISKIFKIELSDLFGFGNMHGGDVGNFLDPRDCYYQNFFIMEPEISFLFVIKKYFAIGLNLSYRIPVMIESKNEHDYYSGWDISGPSAGIDLRFGYFNYKN